jgi:hypothetical protein
VDIHSLADWVTVLAFSATVINALLSVALFSAMLWLKSKFVTEIRFAEHRKAADDRFDGFDRRLNAQSERLNDGQRRFALLDEHLRSLPTREDLHENTLALERLSSDVKVANAKLEGMERLHVTLERQVSVMDEFLRQRER